MQRLSRRYLVGLCAVVLAFASTPVRAEPDSSPCAPRWGRPGEPLVTKTETATAIYLAVERDFFPGAEPAEFPEVVAEDNGDWWIVFRMRPPQELTNGEVVVTRGGGQLTLRIAKCDAAISDVHFSR